MLELKNIKWGLPSHSDIIGGISLKIPDGRLVVITGPNGGGKTTLAKIIAGIVAPDSGSILLDGEDITSLDVTSRAKAGISYAFQQPVRFKGLSVRDLLELSAGHKLVEREICDILARSDSAPTIISTVRSTRVCPAARSSASRSRLCWLAERTSRFSTSPRRVSICGASRA